MKVKENYYMITNTLEILYEDNHIIVCVKPHGIATQSRRLGSPDMVNLLKNHIHKTSLSKGEPYLAVIHRLDQPVTGILVFAKTPFGLRKRSPPPRAESYKMGRSPPSVRGTGMRFPMVYR